MASVRNYLAADDSQVALDRGVVDLDHDRQIGFDGVANLDFFGDVCGHTVWKNALSKVG